MDWPDRIAFTCPHVSCGSDQVLEPPLDNLAGSDCYPTFCPACEEALVFDNEGRIYQEGYKPTRVVLKNTRQRWAPQADSN